MSNQCLQSPELFWKAGRLMQWMCCKCSLGLLGLIYFSFFQDLEVQLEAVNCPWITARVEHTLHVVFSLWCLCLCSSWGFPLLQRCEGVEMENQSSALRLLRVGRSCKLISLVTLTWTGWLRGWVHSQDTMSIVSIVRSEDAAVDQLKCGYLMPQRSWIYLGYKTKITHVESPPKK